MNQEEKIAGFHCEARFSKGDLICLDCHVDSDCGNDRPLKVADVAESDLCGFCLQPLLKVLREQDSERS